MWKLSKEDRSILQRCVNKEGFDYAMLHYSNYDGAVEFNHVKSKEFHEELKLFRIAHQRLWNYLEDNDIEVS